MDWSHVWFLSFAFFVCVVLSMCWYDVFRDARHVPRYKRNRFIVGDMVQSGCVVACISIVVVLAALLVDHFTT